MEKENDVSVRVRGVGREEKTKSLKFCPAQNLKPVTAYCRITCHFK